MIRIAVCEDKNEDLTYLCSMLYEIGLSCTISEYSNAENLLWDIETRNKEFDLFLLDIFLPNMNGIEAARRIRAINEDAVVIFTSFSEDFYREAFDIYAFQYLTKPVSHDVLAEALEKAAQIIERSHEETLTITFHGKRYTLKYSDITYISSHNHMLCFHMQDGSEYTSYGKLDEIAAQLKSDLFTRCHKSFIINLSYVHECATEGFQTESAFIPISRTYASFAKERYHQYLFKIFQDNS